MSWDGYIGHLMVSLSEEREHFSCARNMHACSCTSGLSASLLTQPSPNTPLAAVLQYLDSRAAAANHHLQNCTVAWPPARQPATLSIERASVSPVPCRPPTHMYVYTHHDFAYRMMLLLPTRAAVLNRWTCPTEACSAHQPLWVTMVACGHRVRSSQPSHQNRCVHVFLEGKGDS